MPATRFALRALSELVQIKLNESLREQLGGAYSPSAGGGCQRVPRQEYSFTFQFNSSPENVEKLTKTIKEAVDGSWKSEKEDGGTMSLTPAGLVVRQNQRTHREIENLVDQLRRANEAR